MTNKRGKFITSVARSIDLVDPIKSAKASGLRYVTDSSPGITRQRFVLVLNTLTLAESVCGALKSYAGSSLWRSRPHGWMYGSVRRLMVTCRRPAGMRGDANSTAIIPAGAKYEIKQSTIA